MANKMQYDAGPLADMANDENYSSVPSLSPSTGTDLSDSFASISSIRTSADLYGISVGIFDPDNDRYCESPAPQSPFDSHHPKAFLLEDNISYLIEKPVEGISARAPWDEKPIKDLNFLSERILGVSLRKLSTDPETQTFDLTDEIKLTHKFPVAHGGFSDIHRGEWTHEYEHPWTEARRVETTQVAVKLLRAFTKQEVDLVRARKRLNREVYVWRRLDHPNIAKFYGVTFQMGKRPALVMKWYDNGATPQYIKDHKDVNKLRFVLDVAEGLNYLHTLEKPVIHGDLKGNNTLVDDEVHVILTDFGLSQVVEELAGPSGNTTSSLAGTMRWQAPELLFDEHTSEDSDADSHPTPRSLASDVWSFGCTAYELMTGNLPYKHRLHDWKIIQDIMNKVSPFQEDDLPVLGCHGGLVELLNECWNFSPDERPAMSEVVRKLQSMLERDIG